MCRTPATRRSNRTILADTPAQRQIGLTLLVRRAGQAYRWGMGSWPGQVLIAALGLALFLALRPAVRRLALAPWRRLAVVNGCHRVRPHMDAVPDRRPIEVIAREARRLGHRFRETRHGVSFAKAEGVRRAYDEVLAEACGALGLAHLLAVLADGPELDAERRRVERLLHVWGLQQDDDAA